MVDHVLERSTPDPHRNRLHKQPANDQRPRKRGHVRCDGERDKNSRAATENPRRIAGVRDRCRHGPSRQGTGSAGLGLGCNHDNAFAKIQLHAQFVHSNLPCADLVERGALAQPVGERRFSGFRSCRVEQLEEGAVTEEIEVARVLVALEEARAVSRHAGPLAVQPRQGGGVPALSPTCTLGATKNPLVNHDQARETRDRHEQPRERDRVDLPERKPQQDRCHGDGHESAVGDPQVLTVERSNAFAPCRKTLLVFGAGVDHRVPITSNSATLPLRIPRSPAARG